MLMTIEERINEQFTKEKLVDTLAKYQLFYQIALAVFYNETSFDEKEVSERVKESKLDIEPLHVLNTMKMILESFYDEEDFESILEDNVKINAMLHALNDFVSKTQDLTNKELFEETQREKIMNDEFYNVKMHLHFDNELEERLDYWSAVVTQEAALELKTSAYKLLVS